MTDVQTEEISWLWTNRIAMGKLTLIAGDPGLGKSFVTLDIASRVSLGVQWPDGARNESVGRGRQGVLLLSAEDDPGDTIKPRLETAGAAMEHIRCATSIVSEVPSNNGEKPRNERRLFNLKHDTVELEDAIARPGNCGLVVIDPITAYLTDVDSHNNSDIRSALYPLAEIAKRQGVAMLVVTHLNKSAGGPAIYRAIGSVAFTAAARAVWAVSKDRDDPTGRRRLIVSVKNNLAEEVGGLAYRIESCGDLKDRPCVAWEPDPVTVTADQALATDYDSNDAGSAVAEATNWLREVLADGPVDAKSVKKRAAGDGIAPRTLDRAKAALNVTAAPDGYRGPWVWRMPGDASDQRSSQSASETSTPDA